MGIIINQSVKNAAISYVGIILGFIATITLFPKILDSDEFGLTRVMLSISALSVQFLNFGLPKSIIKFFPVLKELTTKTQGLYWLFISPVVLGLIGFSMIFLAVEFKILEWYASDVELLSEFYILIIPLVIFSSSFGLLNSFLKANFETVIASFLQEVFLRIVTIANLLLFSFEFINFNQFILLFVSNYALQYFLLFFYALYMKKIWFKIDASFINKKLLKEFTTYSFFALFSGLTMLIIGNIDLLMVGTFKGLSQTGIYAVAIYVGAVISIPKRSITKISFPIISNSFKNNNLNNISDIYKKTSLNQYLLGLLIYVGVLANLENLFRILPDEYEAGGIVIVIIGLGNLFDMVTGANGQIIISSKYYKFDFYSSLLIIFSAIVLNYLLIPPYGIIGAALATVLSIFLGNIVRVIFVWIKFRFQPFSLKLLSITLLGGLLLLLAKQFGIHENLYLDIAVRSFLILILYLAGIWIFNLSEDTKLLMVKFKKQIFGL